MIIFYVAAIAAGVEWVKYCRHGSLLFTFLLWGHAEVSLAIFLAALFGKSRLSVVLSYVFVLSTTLGSFAMGLILAGRWPRGLLCVPPLNFARSVSLVFSTADSRAFSRPPTADLVHPPELTAAWIAQFFIGSALLLVGTALHLFLVNDLSASRLSALLRKPSPVKYEDVGQMDTDVADEASRAALAGDGVRIQHLRKEYPTGQVAVKDVSLQIPLGECFGLLGPNGAGKTTVVSMLSGQTPVTACAGAEVCGFDVRAQMDQIHQILGVCPQFDVVWEDLTVREHLLLFARIKGVPEERATVRRIAEAVQLDGDAFYRPAGKLSGGMRRRLSLAIALIANPKVLYLDEPSTGLDPETRQELWRIVSALRPGRCVVLTTHSMEEADALCGRIGIMTQGGLRCIGSPLHLKNKFGSGYQLTLTLANEGGSISERHKKVKDLVEAEVTKDAVQVETFKGERVLQYMFPTTSMQVSKVFTLMQDPRLKQLHVTEWSLAQASLNEVFVRIVKEAENEPQLSKDLLV